MKIIFLGPPGSGKGTYSTRVAEKLGIPHISTGDMFRENVKMGTALGKEASKYMDKGELVPDKLTISMLKDRISKADCNKGFILDGFPRTIAQAEALKAIADIDIVINLDVPDNVVIQRLTSRRVCEKCGQIYNILFLKTKVEGICDKCGGKLIQRKDDTIEVVKDRLEEYEQKTRPLIEFYRNEGKIKDIHTDRADEPVDPKVEEILKVLKSLKK